MIQTVIIHWIWSPARVTSASVIPAISDHEAILFNFNMKPFLYQNSSHSIYLYNRGDFDRIRQYIIIFQQNFLSSKPFTQSVEKNWTDFKNIVYSSKTSTIIKPHSVVKSSNQAQNQATQKTL